MASPADTRRDLSLQGHYAGFVTRFAAFALDVATVVTTFAIAAAVVEYTLGALAGTNLRLADAPVAADLLLPVWWLVYSAYPLAQVGRTFGMAVVGLRVVRADGSPLGVWRTVVRVLTFPLSFPFFGLGFALILLRRDRRAVHDLIAGSAVVYAWDARAARLRFLAKRGAG